MAAVAFDTLKFAERLEKGGFSTQQARAAAEAFAEATGEELATKRDLAVVSSELKAVSAELRLEIQRVEAKFDAKLDHFESSVDAKLELVKRDITIRLGGMMIVGFGVLLAALRFMLAGH